MFEIFQFEFMQNAFLAAILASIACGIIGSLVVVNRIVFISGGIAHTAYGGIGLSFFLGISPLFGAAGFAVVATLIIGMITYQDKSRADTIIGAIWAAGMAFGIILIDLTPGYNVDLMSLLFGSILAVPTLEIYLMTGLAAAILLFVATYYQDLLALSYDPEFAISRGRPVKLLYYTLLVFTALTVVMVIQVVGLILVIALLTIPPYLAEYFSKSLAGMMAGASIFSVIFSVSGLLLSYYYNLTSGASIIMVATVTFFFISISRKLLR